MSRASLEVEEINGQLVFTTKMEPSLDELDPDAELPITHRIVMDIFQDLENLGRPDEMQSGDGD